VLEGFGVFFVLQQLEALARASTTPNPSNRFFVDGKSVQQIIS